MIGKANNAATYSRSTDKDTGKADQCGHGESQSVLESPVLLSLAEEVVEPHAGFHAQTQD